MTRLNARQFEPMAVATPVAKPRLDIVQRLLFLAIVSMPFQQALTIRVGFPLKITEICIVLAIGLSVAVPRLATGRLVGTNLVVILGALVVISTLWTFEFTKPPVTTAFGYDLGFTNDMLLYCAYALLALSSWFILGRRLDLATMERAISIAVRLAFVYCAVQLASHFLGFAIPSFLNPATQMGATFGASLPRNGPFLEGNYLGFFAGVALFACVHRRDRLGILLALVCVVYSQSTSSLLGIVIAAAVTATLRPQRGVAFQVFTLGAAGVAAAALVPNFQRFLLGQADKLGILGEADATHSRDARSQSTQTAINMAIGNPLFGVGPGRYGVWRSEYLSADADVVSVRASRGIANNAWAQLAAETGVIAVAVFGLLMLVLAIRLFRRGGSLLALSIYLIVTLNSAASWTALTIWIAIAIAAAAASELLPERLPPRQATPYRMPRRKAISASTGARA